MSAISRQQVVSSSNSNTNSNDLFVINNAQTNSDSSSSINELNEEEEEENIDEDENQLNKTFLTDKDMKIFDDMFTIEENLKENLKENDEINLPLNLNLITVTETETDDDSLQPITFRTKKFYESDDTIINQIFSQTITSAGVTPTEEYEIFSFETNDDDHHQQNELKEKTGVGDWNLTIDEQIPPNNGVGGCSGGGGSGGVSQTDSHTENLDNFMENDGLKSLIETATNNILNGIEDDFIDYDVSSEVNLIYENLPQNSETQPPSINEIDSNLNIYENVIFENNAEEIDETIYENIIVDTNQRVSIVVDCYDDQQERSEPFYVEPLTPQNEEKSYFDTTIEDSEDFDELNNKNKIINQTTNINILTHDEDEIISDDNMVTYSDESDSDDEEIENLINDDDGVDNHSCINVHVSFKSFFFLIIIFVWLN